MSFGGQALHGPALPKNFSLSRGGWDKGSNERGGELRTEVQTFYKSTPVIMITYLNNLLHCMTVCLDHVSALPTNLVMWIGRSLLNTILQNAIVTYLLRIVKC